MSRRLDISGQIYGRLLVIVTDWYKTNLTGRTYWFCQCEDNNIVSVSLHNLRNGTTKSCGCLNKELASERMQKIKKNQRGRNNPKWKEKEVIICKWCGKKRKVVPSLKGTTQFCNEKCYGQWMSENNKKENNPNWKNGITPLHKQIRTSKKHKEFIIQVFERDNYTCLVSKEIGKDLHVHHKKGFAKILEENNITTREEAENCKELWNIDNAITLSEKWHRGIKTDNPNAFHRVYGNFNFTEEDFYKWFEKFSFKTIER